MRSVFSLSFYMYASLCETRKEQLIMISPEKRGIKNCTSEYKAAEGRKISPPPATVEGKKISIYPPTTLFPLFFFRARWDWGRRGKKPDLYTNGKEAFIWTLKEDARRQPGLAFYKLEEERKYQLANLGNRRTLETPNFRRSKAKKDNDNIIRPFILKNISPNFSPSCSKFQLKSDRFLAFPPFKLYSVYILSIPQPLPLCPLILLTKIY